MQLISPESHQIAARHNVIPDIHDTDFVFDFVKTKIWNGDHERAVANYYELGNYSAALIAEYIKEFARVREQIGRPYTPKHVLDFASGYGCAARHMSRYFPESLISTCDIHQDAVNFNASILGLRSFLSSPKPEELMLPKQDLIFALSFFSHMPESSYARWLIALSGRLNPGGVLIFTSNGLVTQQKLFPDWATDDRGYAFRPESEQHDLDKAEYGLTLAGSTFVFNILKSRTDLHLSRFQEGVWWAVQDVYVCTKISR